MAQEFQEKVRQLEGKVATLTVINQALQNENETLRHDQSSAGRQPAATEAELHELQEEFTRRIAAADRTIASLKEKNEGLRGAMEAASRGGDANEARLHDQQAYISSLQAEGEVMSRKNGELEVALRKVRSQVRKLESDRDRLASRLASLESSLAGEQERAMHATQAAALQIEQMEDEMQAAKQEAASQVAAARKEAAAAKDTAHREAQQHGASTMASAMEREATLSNSLSDLRAEYEAASAAFFAREEGLRQEVSRLEDRTRALEEETAELAAASSDHTRPLMRQIEAMAASAAAQQAGHAEAQAELLERLKVAEAAAASLKAAEESLRAKLLSSERALVVAKSGLEGASAQASALRQQLSTEQRRISTLSTDLKHAEERLGAAKRREDTAGQRAEADAQLLQQRLLSAEEKVSALEADRLHWQERYQEGLRRAAPASPVQPLPVSHAAPGKELDATPATAWQGAAGNGHGNAVAAGVREEPPDDLDKLIRAASEHGRHAQGKHVSNGPVVEATQLQHMQRRLAAAEADAEGARAEALRACQRAEAAAADVARCNALDTRLQELQKRYEMALELLGERNEYVDKLEDDIREMKSIFHTQLSLMADQLSMAKQNGSAVVK